MKPADYFCSEYVSWRCTCVGAVKGKSWAVTQLELMYWFTATEGEEGGGVQMKEGLWETHIGQRQNQRRHANRESVMGF